MPKFDFTGYVSVYFALFLVGSILIYWLFPKKIRFYTILVFSVAFYALISWKSIPFLAYSIGLNYFIGRIITSNNKKTNAWLEENASLDKEAKKEYKNKQKKKRKTFLILGIIGNVLVLVLMKYLNFLTGNVNSIIHLFGGSFEFPLNRWILPLGISFYTFQAISYIVDIYWNKYECETNFVKFSIFMTYFPKIMQGPIIRYGDMKDELFGEKTFDYVTFTDGAKRMAYGYFKKMLVADTLAVFVTYAFTSANIPTISGMEAFLAVIFYFIQDYCDFSGYMDISIGISGMLGIKLPENFRRPYFAVAIDEYWRRWHITLGTWFKDYVYYPLSISKFSLALGKKSKKAFGSWGMKVPAIIGLILVWFLTGLWHGASWNYVLWGLYYGAIIILSICFEPLFNLFYEKTHISRNNIPIRIFKHIRTIFLLIIGRILFMSSSLSDAWAIFTKMFMWSDNNLSNLNNQLGYISVIAGVVGFIPILVIDIIQEIRPTTSFLEKFNKTPIVLRWSLLIVMIVLVVWFGWYGSGLPRYEFGYVQFQYEKESDCQINLVPSPFNRSVIRSELWFVRSSE